MQRAAERQRRLIRADGSCELLSARLSMAAIRTMIRADGLDTVNLRHLGHPLVVMLVDDNGQAKGLPVNRIATSLYWANCVPGTDHQIRGDVVVVEDDDFAQPGGVSTPVGPYQPFTCVQCKKPFRFGERGEDGANVFTLPGQRETGITGMCELCWDALFSDTEDREEGDA
jgi:hypothetical protein